MTLTTRARYPLRDGVVSTPTFWITSAGHSFWMDAANMVSFKAIMSATNHGFSGVGWGNALGFTSAVSGGNAGDLLSSSDWDTGFTGVGSTRWVSPRIFGGYDHGLQAARFLGYFPTKLTAEFAANFVTASANETTTFVGLGTVNDAATAGTAAAIVSDGTNFRLRSGSGNDAGATIDTNKHVWKIVVDATNTEWFIDGVSQGTITTEADIWPVEFRVAKGTTNQIALGWVNVYYS